MLRINLLPIRQLKKRAKARNQIVGFSMVFVAILLALGFVGLLQLSKVETVEASIAELQREEKRLAPIIREVDALEQQKSELERRIEVIKKLRRESSLTVRVMDEVARIVDNDRMWLQSLSQQGRSLQLSGIALDNQTIAQFMEELKTSQFVRDVTLKSSTLSKVSNRDFKSFSLSAAVGFPAEPKEEKAAQQ